MKATEKFKLSRELNALVGQVQAGTLKGLEKLKTSRRINEIVTLLGGGSNAATQAPEVDINVDLTPFERIVRDNEITIETLQGAVDSTRMLLNSVSLPSIVLDAVKVVSGQIESGALLDSLGADGEALIRQFANAMLDSTNSPDGTDQGAKVLNDLLVSAGWTIGRGIFFSHAEEQFSFRINKNRLYTFDVEVYQNGIFVHYFTSNGVYLQDVVNFMNEYIQGVDNKLDYYTYSNANEYDARISRMQMRKKPEEYIELADAAAQAAATSQVNHGENPTQEQLEANDYKTAKVNIAGMNISIENPIGSIRQGVDAEGQAWKTQMTAHYGYFDDTTGADGDELDVFIAANTPHDFDGKIFVIGQLDAKGNFDEHKVMLGVESDNEAQQLYRAHYDENFNGIGYIHSFSIEDFKDRAYTGKTALFDSIRPLMLDSWADDGRYELLPFKKLDQGKLDQKMTEAKATIKEPIVVLADKSKYYVVHGRNRLEIAVKNAESYVPSIVFNADQGYTIDDIKKAVRKCGNVVHAEALGAMIEECASHRLEAAL